MRARDLAVPYPLLPADAPAAEAARLLAEEEVDAVFVERHGQLQGVVSDIGLLVRLLPGYIIEDPKLAQVMEEGAADLLWRRLEGHTAGELLAKKGSEVPQVDGDATLMEVAAVMAGARAPMVAVRQGDRLIGGITSSALLTRLLGP
ncbi:MAG TPA: CBS domain-containing protein [Actinomycetota bacterium]|nr:CBS domain-containing protein [Actinomycetota bacterium]